MVKTLPCNARGAGLIRGQATKIPHAPEPMRHDYRAVGYNY